MGACSTIYVTRSKAKAAIVAKLLQGIDDKLLEEWMDALLYDRCYNCSIVPDGTEENDDIIVG